MLFLPSHYEAGEREEERGRRRECEAGEKVKEESGRREGEGTGESGEEDEGSGRSKVARRGCRKSSEGEREMQRRSDGHYCRSPKGVLGMERTKKKRKRRGMDDRERWTSSWSPVEMRGTPESLI